MDDGASASAAGEVGVGGAGGGAGEGGNGVSGDAGGGAAGQGGSPADAGGGAGGHPGDRCAGPADCPGGACWQRLDGVKECVLPSNIPRDTSPTCGPGLYECCLTDASCVKGTHGRCVARQADLSCGGAAPYGNSCRYDDCGMDADCRALAPPGAMVSACVPAGALGFFTSTCIHGGCRTDADCTLHPEGRCLFGLAATHNGQCDLRQVFYCAYPSDPCQEGPNACPGSPPAYVCLPNENYQGRHCGPSRPAFP